MSVDISVSNLNKNKCNDLLKLFLKEKINCRTINTTSIVENKIEEGCLMTFSQEYRNKEKINYLWNIIKKEYECAHLQIPGLYNGCILNYINNNHCPANKLNK
jgi:hypothetical protein|tara:strand:- start:806 stop:1114 length:309 start_codon:yes stop_codon:yes gene_type:complete